MPQVIESGSGDGYTMAVTSTGSAKTHVSNTVETTVTGEASTRPGQGTVTRTVVTVGTSDTKIVDANSSRVAIQIMNIGANRIHVRLGTSAADTDDVFIDPGAIYEFPGGIGYAGEIRGIAVTSAAKASVNEFNLIS